jgi:hypothetical protein
LARAEGLGDWGANVGAGHLNVDLDLGLTHLAGAEARARAAYGLSDHWTATAEAFAVAPPDGPADYGGLIGLRARF